MRQDAFVRSHMLMENFNYVLLSTYTYYVTYYLYIGTTY